MIVGVEFHDGGQVIAGAVDDTGAVTRRELVEAGSDRVAAALTAIEQVTKAADGYSAIGIAASDGARPDAERMLTSLNARDADRVRDRAILGPGTAAAVAECWIGAARGASDVVY